MLLLFAKFIAAFSAYGKAGQIGFAMAMGLVLALVPGGTVIWFILFIPMMLVRINQAAMLGTMGVFRLMANLYDPLTERLGYAVLTMDFMEPIMSRVLAVPLLAWFRLDDSFVFGGTLAGILGLPLWILIFTLVVLLYRRYMAGAVKSFFGKIGAGVPILGKLSKAVGAARRVGVVR